MRYVSSLALLALCFVVGCGGNRPEPGNVHAKVKDNIKLALSNLGNEGESIRLLQNGIKAALQNISKESEALRDLEHAIKFEISELLPANTTINATIESALESELAKEIFSQKNAVSVTDSEVIYRLSPTLCEKVPTITQGQGGAELVMMCQMFLSQMTLDLHVKSLGENAVDLELWHANALEKDATPLFVIGLSASPTSLGTKFSFDGAKKFVDSLSAFLPGIPVGGTMVEGFKKLTGELSLRLQFASDKASSGCQNGERVCFVANVDRPILIQTQSEDPFALSIGASPAAQPTVTVSAHKGGDFVGAFNFGAIEGSFADAKDKYSLYIDTLSFTVSVPKTESSEQTTILVEKFKTGAKHSFVQFGQQKVDLKLSNNGKEIDSMKLVLGRRFAPSELTVSPLTISLNFTDEKNPECKSSERVTVKTDANTSTRLTLGDLRDHSTRSDKCDPDNLVAYAFFSQLKVVQDQQTCQDQSHVQVKDGSLAMQYSYSLNGTEGKAISLNAAQGQCLGM